MPSPELTLDVWRMAVVGLCRYACGNEAGRSKDDPVYMEVTENRDGPGPTQRKAYSSCGDLAHWLYMRLGIREGWINRTDDGAFGPWRPGENVSRLWGGACPLDFGPPSDPTWFPAAGDVVLIWNTGNDAHVMVALEVKDDELVTANYGAGGMSAAASPGARIARAPIARRNGRHFYGQPFHGQRQIQRFLPLSEAVRHISVEPNLRGAELNGEVIEAVQSGWRSFRT